MPVPRHLPKSIIDLARWCATDPATFANSPNSIQALPVPGRAFAWRPSAAALEKARALLRRALTVPERAVEAPRGAPGVYLRLPATNSSKSSGCTLIAFEDPQVSDLSALDQRVGGGGADREALGHLAHSQEPDHGAQLWSAGGPARGARNDRGRSRWDFSNDSGLLCK